MLWEWHVWRWFVLLRPAAIAWLNDWIEWTLCAGLCTRQPCCNDCCGFSCKLPILNRTIVICLGPWKDKLTGGIAGLTAQKLICNHPWPWIGKKHASFWREISFGTWPRETNYQGSQIRRGFGETQPQSHIYIHLNEIHARIPHSPYTFYATNHSRFDAPQFKGGIHLEFIVSSSFNINPHLSLFFHFFHLSKKICWKIQFALHYKNKKNVPKLHFSSLFLHRAFTGSIRKFADI